MKSEIVTRLKSWKQIFELDKFFLSPFVFRGQANSEWGLETSLERTISKFKLHTYSKDYTTNERWMLHEFKRKSHLYLHHNINVNDHFEWLAIMQHHGAPTRLLDFTYSIFVASFFAVIDSNTDAAIWAINRHIIRDNLVDNYNLNYKKRKILKDEVNRIQIEYANSFISRQYSKDFKYPSVVIPLEPKLLSERLSKQQGLFLMPSNPEIDFIDNLLNVFNLNTLSLEDVEIEALIEKSKKELVDANVQIIKIEIPSNLHNEIVQYLKEMNLTSESLFPGLDGLAQSLVQTQIRE